MGMDLAADGNENGQVDDADFGVWRAHFGNTAELGGGAFVGDPATIGVPEPTSQLMLILAILAFCLQRRHSP